MTTVNCEYVPVSEQAAVRSNWRVTVTNLSGESSAHWGLTSRHAYEEARKAYSHDGLALVAIVQSEHRRSQWLQVSGLVERS